MLTGPVKARANKTPTQKKILIIITIKMKTRKGEGKRQALPCVLRLSDVKSELQWIASRTSLKYVARPRRLGVAPDGQIIYEINSMK